MPNNLVFNDSAENLKVQSFGATSGGTVTSLLVANDGVLQVGGTITAAIADTVTVTGAVSVTANSFDIRALSSVTDTVSVAGSITATIANTVTVTGEVSVTANSFDIRALSSATDTVSVAGSITATIANTVTVTGEVSVTANSFDIRALSSATDTVSVAGSVTATIANTVTITGEVSVTANNFDIRALSSATDTVSVAGSVTATIANTVTVSVGGYGFTSSDLNIALTDVSLTNTAFSFDTSQMKQYSFYVVNTGTAAISVRLQVSPTTSETYFVPDNTSEVALTQDQAAVLVPGYFLNYTRVQVLGAQTATAVAYFNGQN